MKNQQRKELSKKIADRILEQQISLLRAMRSNNKDIELYLRKMGLTTIPEDIYGKPPLAQIILWAECIADSGRAIQTIELIKRVPENILTDYHRIK